MVIVKQGSKWAVMTEDRGRVLGTHDSEEAANRQLRAIEANKKKEDGGSYDMGTPPTPVVDDDERWVEGFISTEITDRQGDYVPIQELEKAMGKYVERGGHIFNRHRIPVGRIDRYETKTNPNLNKPGLWVKAKIFKDYSVDDEAWKEIKEGRYTGFSIGARSKKNRLECNGTECRNRATDIELWENSVVPRPANPGATITRYNNLAKEDSSCGCNKNESFAVYLNKPLEKEDSIPTGESDMTTPFANIPFMQDCDGYTIEVKKTLKKEGGCGCGGKCGGCGGKKELNKEQHRPTGDTPESIGPEGVSGDVGEQGVEWAEALKTIEAYCHETGSEPSGRSGKEPGQDGQVGGTLGGEGVSGEGGSDGIDWPKSLRKDIEALQSLRTLLKGYDYDTSGDADKKAGVSGTGKSDKPPESSQMKVDQDGRVPKTRLESLLETVITKLETKASAMEKGPEFGEEGIAPEVPEAAGEPKPGDGLDKEKPQLDKPEGEDIKKDDEKEDNTDSPGDDKMTGEQPATEKKELKKEDAPAPAAPEAVKALTKEEVSEIAKGIVSESVKEMLKELKVRSTETPKGGAQDSPAAPTAPAANEPKNLTKEFKDLNKEDIENLRSSIYKAAGASNIGGRWTTLTTSSYKQLTKEVNELAENADEPRNALPLGTPKLKAK